MPSERMLKDYQREHSRVVPRYELLYRLLIDKIISMPPEQEFLPYQEQLAEQYKLSRNTVRRALAKLQREGYIETVKKSGSRVLRRTIEAHCPSLKERNLSGCIGVILSNNVDDPSIRTGIRWKLVDEIERQFGRCGIRIVVYNLRENQWSAWRDFDKIVYSLRANGIMHVIYLPDQNEYFPWLDLNLNLLQNGIRVSLCFNSLFDVAEFSSFLLPGTDFVAVNHENTLFETLKKLLEDPVKRIIYVVNESYRKTFSDFRAESIQRFATTQQKEFHYLIAPYRKLLNSDYERNEPDIDNETAMKVSKLCEESNNLVLCANDYSAQSLLKWCSKLPGAIIVGYDNTKIAENLGISTFCFNMFARAEALLSLHITPSDDVRGVVVNSTFVDRRISM